MGERRRGSKRQETKTCQAIPTTACATGGGGGGERAKDGIRRAIMSLCPFRKRNHGRKKKWKPSCGTIAARSPARFLRHYLLSTRCTNKSKKHSNQSKVTPLCLSLPFTHFFSFFPCRSIHEFSGQLLAACCMLLLFLWLLGKIDLLKKCTKSQNKYTPPPESLKWHYPSSFFSESHQPHG